MLNVVAKGAMRVGVSIAGSRVLAVRGRTTGAWHTTPVNLLTFEHARYLVAPRGHTQWVRNLRARGTGELRLGRSVEQFRADEVPDDAKVPILRGYLEKWRWESGQFFAGVTSDSSDSELARVAPDHPVFRIRTDDPG